MRSATRKKTGKDSAYLKWIRTLPCVCCCVYGYGRLWLDLVLAPDMRQSTILVEAAHTRPHALSQKSDDRTCIPLCHTHHQGSPLSIHVLGVKFWDRWGIERDELVAKLNEEYARLGP
jgi:hypothetical protein